MWDLAPAHTMGWTLAHPIPPCPPKRQPSPGIEARVPVLNWAEQGALGEGVVDVEGRSMNNTKSLDKV